MRDNKDHRLVCETCISSVSRVLPGEIVFYKDKAFLAINPTAKGFLFKSIADSHPLALDRKEKIEIVKKLEYSDT